jgi:hypothetical protein
MNWYKFASLMVALTGFVAIVTAIETPRKPKSRDEVAHILPRVEDMYENPTPLQF